ncbi:FeoA family protein [Mucisphaera sp.]|uniref:FeoA family protein n=1 Tax=Mucisphaera sp. TaxID=2913024 RepID=UPI003D0E37C7
MAVDAGGLLTLGDLQRGACATIREVQAGPFDAERLKAMGLCSGRRVTVLKRGQPMIVSVMGSRIGLDRHLARFIELVPVERDSACCMDPVDAEADAKQGEGVVS